jgi:hypothetical protein
VRQGNELMARINAERLVELLARSGYVIMKKSPAQSHGMPRSTDPP